MKLDEDLKDNLRSYVNDIVAEYSEKEFDMEKFFLFLFALYEQSQSLEDFADICRKELVDFFSDNTENFVNEIMTHISLNVDLANELDRRNSKIADQQDGNNSSASSAEDQENNDDMIHDEDEEDGDTNYRRDRNKSDSKEEHHHHHHHKHSETTTKPHHNLQKHTENKKDNKGQKEHQRKKPSFPQGPPPQIPGMMPVGMPNMRPPNKGPMPPGMWPPYSPYMYPMPYMPPSYPPVYPYEMMYPQPIRAPEGKPPEYDPLQSEVNRIGKHDVKPPVKPPESQHNQHGKRPITKRDDKGEGPNPTKVQVVVKEGKKGPRLQSQQQDKKQASAQAETTNPKTTIYVKNIPDYYNNLEALNNQLKKFGPIVNIKVDLKSKTSRIEFLNPKHAKFALSSKQPLFGNKEIIVTGDLEAMSEDSNKEAKFEGQLLEKLKFLMEIKKHMGEARKEAIVNKLNEIKHAQKTKEIPESLKKLLDYPIFDLNVEFSQIIENVPDNYLGEKNKLSSRLEAFGKMENFKLNPKTKTLELKFYNLSSAMKAQEALVSEFQIKFVNDKVQEVIKKIIEFEQNFLLLNETSAIKKNGGDNGDMQSHQDPVTTMT